MSTIEAMQRQLLGLIGRAVVKSISAATKCQTVDVSLIAGEPKAGVEHLEPYGFTARANSGAEAVVLFPDGDRSLCDDARYRQAASLTWWCRWSRTGLSPVLSLPGPFQNVLQVHCET